MQEDKNSIRKFSFPAGKIARITNSLENFIKIFKHDELALHTHLASMNVLEQYSCT